MTRPPNIVWICMDQHPLANRGPVPANLALQARVAGMGTRFANAFTVLPICSPARASMLTGLYPHAHGLTENDGRFGGRSGLNPDDWMVQRDFAQAGYRCAWFGKWHLDNHSDAGRFGFEGWSLPGYGYPYATPEYADYLRRKSLPKPIAEIEVPGESRTKPGTRITLTDVQDWPDYEAGTLRLDGPAACHEAYFVADLARDWIARNAGSPFFVRIDPWGPHPPYMVTRPFDGCFGNDIDFRTSNFHSDLTHRPGHHRDYRDEWSEIGWNDADWRLMSRRSVQQAALVEAALTGVLDTLAATGLDANTLIVVCADHGDAVASNGGVANKGGLLVEETVRIPLLISGPGIEAGHVSARLVTNLDIAPTIAAAAGLPMAEFLHGRDALAPTSPDRSGVMLQHYGLHKPLLQRAWHTGTWKLIVQEDGFQELYDIGQDPGEMTNLAMDPACADRLAGLRMDLFDQMARLGDEGVRQTRLKDAAIAR